MVDRNFSDSEMNLRFVKSSMMMLLLLLVVVVVVVAVVFSGFCCLAFCGFGAVLSGFTSGGAFSGKWKPRQISDLEKCVGIEMTNKTDGHCSKVYMPKSGIPRVPSQLSARSVWMWPWSSLLRLAYREENKMIDTYDPMTQRKEPPALQSKSTWEKKQKLCRIVHVRRIWSIFGINPFSEFDL